MALGDETRCCILSFVTSESGVTPLRIAGTGGGGALEDEEIAATFAFTLPTGKAWREATFLRDFVDPRLDEDDVLRGVLLNAESFVEEVVGVPLFTRIVAGLASVLACAAVCGVFWGDPLARKLAIEAARSEEGCPPSFLTDRRLPLLAAGRRLALVEALVEEAAPAVGVEDDGAGLIKGREVLVVFD